MSSAATATVSVSARLASIDMLRGIVMILMALDHSRDFFSPFPYQPEDLSQASAALFLTRWITHFCAPTFMFLAGTGAFLYGGHPGVSRESLRRFLVTRGLFLILLEVTLISYLWRFHIDGIVLQVIWAIGCSMICLALLLDLPVAVIAAVGAVLIIGHNLLDHWHAQDFVPFGTGWSWLWSILHEPSPAGPRPGFQVSVWYPLVPWMGVMALGYAFGTVMQKGPEARRRFMLLTGAGLLAAFLILRLTNAYGDPSGWSVNPRGALYTVLSVLNVTKYPPSLCYLLLTLGVVMLVLPAMESWRGRLARFFGVFGRVPLAFYVLHLLLLHLSAAIIAHFVYGPHPLDPKRAVHYHAGLEPSLLRAYIATALAVVCLYPVCHWYANYKARHKEQWWLSYL